MQITHKEAHRLIQFKADKRLDSIDEERLGTHLKLCVECRDYLDDIKNTETVLRKSMQKRWRMTPPPLSMDAIYGRVGTRTNTMVLLATRYAFIGVAFMVLAFFAWQSLSNGGSAAQQSPSLAVPPIPTPLLEYTATSTLQKDCRNIQYFVREGDTLENIARQFAVPMESITSANDLPGKSLTDVRVLTIPICETTPVSTTHPPTFTITPGIEWTTTASG